MPFERPEMIALYDNYRDGDEPRMHWYEHPGGGWTAESAMARVVCEVDIHWLEERTPAGKPLDFYLARLGRIALFHHKQRDWNEYTPGIQKSDGIQYHYAITPPGHIIQVSPETKRTWHAYESNGHSLAVVMMAGHGDPVSGQAADALRR